jgi:uncharacterized membrane protein
MNMEYQMKLRAEIEESARESENWAQGCAVLAVVAQVVGFIMAACCEDAVWLWRTFFAMSAVFFSVAALIAFLLGLHEWRTAGALRRRLR